MEHLIDTFGEPAILATAGVLVGILFGICAQRTQFCLRASAVELAQGHLSHRSAVWFLAFSGAVSGVQGAVALGWLDLSEARALASTGSMSGAIVGGLMFGAGMILARGCASRLLVLASTGNLRALVTGLVLTLVAQAAYKGVLAPPREYLANLWTVLGGDTRSLMVMLGLSPAGLALVGLAACVMAWVFAARQGIPVMRRVLALGVGMAVTLGWCATYAIAQASFEVVPVASITFTGPATDTLMVLVTQRGLALSFGIGLVPGVAIGACVAALISRTWTLQRFGPDTPMERYLIGAVLMGFGAMLAGGCAVGAGLSGAAAMSITAWVAVGCMWLGALLMQMLQVVSFSRVGRA